MSKKSLFVVLFVILCMAVMTASVSADQIGNKRWCNSDQYGCWITGDDVEQVYIMFWSESARDLFMGPGSNATVAPAFPMGEMPLDVPPAAAKRAYSRVSGIPFEFKDLDGNTVFSTDSAEEFVNYMNEQGFVDENGNPLNFFVNENGYPESKSLDTNSEQKSDEPGLPEYRSAEGKTIEEMKEFLVGKMGTIEAFNEWLKTATDEEIIYNYKYLNLD